ncbi:helix-turn-helix transcriptional regulator [Bacillus thuringiensis]|jgi:DNA-binding XRE family transcriptional regulator|nr:helix-turn-helix transcriptional regulator [Bacillus thuringiensis]
MNIGRQIQYFRKRDNMSQEKLAEKIHVSRQSISNWENERNYPDIHISLGIYKNFGIHKGFDIHMSLGIYKDFDIHKSFDTLKCHSYF